MQIESNKLPFLPAKATKFINIIRKFSSYTAPLMTEEKDIVKTMAHLLGTGCVSCLEYARPWSSPSQQASLQISWQVLVLLSSLALTFDFFYQLSQNSISWEGCVAFHFMKLFHSILIPTVTLILTQADPDPSPYHDSPVAVTCIKINGREMRCREVNSPVSLMGELWNNHILEVLNLI